MPAKKDNSLQTFFVGLVLFIISLPLAGSGVVALQAVAGFLILVGLGMMFIGWVQHINRKRTIQVPAIAYPYPPTYAQPIIIQAPPTSTHSEVTTREIVKVRCRNCNSLNFETAARCTNCGASL